MTTCSGCGVFVDLYRVVRQGIRAGVESYSIKRLEPLCGYIAAGADLPEATENLIAFEAALEEATGGGDAGTSGGRRRGYNEDDCRATLALRDWLEGRRPDLAARLGEELPRPAVTEQAQATEDPEVAADQGRRCWPTSPRTTVRADRRAAGQGAARRPARLAPARGQARLVAVLLRPHAELW